MHWPCVELNLVSLCTVLYCTVLYHSRLGLLNLAPTLAQATTPMDALEIRMFSRREWFFDIRSSTVTSVAAWSRRDEGLAELSVRLLVLSILRH